MSEAPAKLVIATRASRLALWQAEHVRDRLQTLYPQCEVSLLTMTTRGDQILDRSLSKVGGKGLFVKELETALLDGRADLAVHSLKDVPVDMQSPFALSVILERDDPRDAFVSNEHASLDELPAGSVVGTSSLRREAQIRQRYPQLQVQPLRGNLDTRLGKLDRGDYAAIILASAGLRRLGMQARIRSHLSPEQSLPAAGQGALGIEILEARTDMQAWLAPLADPDTTACALAERAVSRVLGGSCQVPLAAFAQRDGDTLMVRGLVAEPDGSRIIRAQASGAIGQAEELGVCIANELLQNGARIILDRLLASGPAA
ncbi:hydroxymethylbilane synthase [Pollutimonas harenae]|uniref:Porphobilinogen deaminase n=1 Tax=Pollutimonas harenae TaxID=657015 RepID=A0A853GRV9_9BURK|nr:hydroxymethylbilane synthase [Pollutimonas harenae]NYT85828.1 hydroxymethylbilane synthase [Pollutimonas harenae]TEA70886.1 hydroxymethylbilane synthase [Pollutimonas harenae]